MTNRRTDERPGDPLLAIRYDVRELVEPRKHRQRFSTWDNNRNRKTCVHVAEHPSLLDQLRELVAPGRAGDDAPAGGYTARPAASLAPIDVLERIRREVDDVLVRWFGRLPRHVLEDDLRAIVGELGQCDDDTLADLSRRSFRWVVSARIVAGWDSAPWRPRATCPYCAARNSLRVQLADHVALCVACDQAWDASTIGELADHVAGVVVALPEPAPNTETETTPA